MARDNFKFTVRMTAHMVKELKNVMTSMLEDRTESRELGRRGGLAEAGFAQSPSRKARYRVLGDWHKAVTSTVDHRRFTAEVEVLNEYWKCTASLRNRDSGEQARAAVVVTGRWTKVISAELVTELMAGTTEAGVRAAKTAQQHRDDGAWAPHLLNSCTSTQ